MSSDKRRTRRDVQAELHENNSKNRRRKKRDVSEDGQTKVKKSFFAPLLIIEAVLVIILFNFLGYAIVIGIAAIPVLYALIARSRAKKGKKRPKGTFIVFIIYLVIVVVGVQTNSFLMSLFSSKQVNEFYVLALDEDPANSLDEIDDWSTIALGSETSYQTNTFAQAKFAEDGYNFNYTSIELETDAVNALLNGKEQYIVVEDYKDSALRSIDGYKTNTKVIGHYREVIEIESGSKNVTKEPFTVLLTGVDARSDAIDTPSRSDSLMVVKVDPKAESATIVSIPRDAYVSSSCIGEYDKITHSSLNGMNCLIDDVEMLLDIDIDYYMSVNFFAVIDAVDAVGGIEVEVEHAFCGQDQYDNLNAYCLDGGIQQLSGAEALSYARERSSFADGDYARARHQQQVIDGFVSAMTSSSPFVIANLLDIASDSARTNLSAKQLTNIAKIIQKSDDFAIDSYTLEGSGASVNITYWGLYGTSVQVINEESLSIAKQKLQNTGQESSE